MESGNFFNFTTFSTGQDSEYLWGGHARVIHAVIDNAVPTPNLITYNWDQHWLLKIEDIYA